MITLTLSPFPPDFIKFDVHLSGTVFVNINTDKELYYGLIK